MKYGDISMKKADTLFMSVVKHPVLYLYNSYFTNESHKKGKFSNLRNFE